MPILVLQGDPLTLPIIDIFDTVVNSAGAVLQGSSTQHIGAFRIDHGPEQVVAVDKRAVADRSNDVRAINILCDLVAGGRIDGGERGDLAIRGVTGLHGHVLVAAGAVLDVVLHRGNDPTGGVELGLIQPALGIGRGDRLPGSVELS